MNLYLFLALLSALVIRAYTRSSLTFPGILAAITTAIIHGLAPSSLPFILLITFYTLGTVATKVKHNIKATLTITSTATAPPGRTATQVFANSIFATICTFLHARANPPCGPDLLLLGVIANYAATTADTLSSELGILARTKPRLITTGRVCPPGTNGGVTAWGLFAGAAGAAVIGCVSAALLPCGSGSERAAVVVFATAVGTAGSLLDSLLGAVAQESVVDVRTGKVVEAPGGGRVLVAPGGVKLTLKGKAKAKAGRAPEGAGQAVGKVAGEEGGKEGSRRVLTGRGWLTNNGVNAAMAGCATVGGMVGWALWKDGGVGAVGEEVARGLLGWAKVLEL